MKYAKLIYNALQFAPKVLRVDGRTYINPDEETLVAHGYKPLRDERPKVAEGQTYRAVGYTETADAIVRTYEVINLPKQDPVEARRIAYEAEADTYARAYVGYMLEGDAAKAAEAKARYLEAKQFIREQYPDEVTE